MVDMRPGLQDILATVLLAALSAPQLLYRPAGPLSAKASDSRDQHRFSPSSDTGGPVFLVSRDDQVRMPWHRRPGGMKWALAAGCPAIAGIDPCGAGPARNDTLTRVWPEAGALLALHCMLVV
jgi:hypothetical protein